MWPTWIPVDDVTYRLQGGSSTTEIIIASKVTQPSSPASLLVTDARQHVLVMLESPCVTVFRVWFRRWPGSAVSRISQQPVADGGEDGDPVLGGGGGVSAGWRTGYGWFSPSGAGRRSSAGFSRAAGRVRPGCWWRGDGGVGEEPQHVGLARSRRRSSSVQGRRLLALGAGDAADLGEPDGDAAAEQLQLFGGAVRGDSCHALITGQVCLVDEAAQRACDLAGPDRVRVGLGGVFKIAEQVLGTQLVADAVEGVVVDVPVVHDHGAVQVAVDEVLEGGQVPGAEEIIGEQAGAGDLQVLLAGLRAGAGAQRGLVAADDPGEDDQRPDRLVRRGDRPGGAGQQARAPTRRWAGCRTSTR